MIQREVSDRFADAAGMFGEESFTAIPPLTDFNVSESALPPVTTGDAVFQGLCLLLLFCIALLMRYRYELQSLLSGLVRGFAEDFESSRKLTALTNGFFRMTSLTGVLTVAVIAVKYLFFILPSTLEVEKMFVVPGAAAGVVAAIAAVALYQRIVLLVVGFVSGNGDFTDTLWYVKRACFAVTALALAPVVLLSALSSHSGMGWLYLIALECFILAFVFLKETFVLFIRKKIPIFQWFLYLCTVEAFPLTLICASIARFR